VIERHALQIEGRHRALADARALWAFIEALYRDIEADTIAEAVKRVLRIPSLPPQLAPDALDGLPEAPGVYLFYGLNALPLYIGKSRNLRERVGAHFSSDYRSATDLRISAEIRRIHFEETAGEIGALLRESALVKAMLPAHNHALRRKVESGVLELTPEPGPPRFYPAAAVEASDLAGRYGPFTSKRAARETLRQLSREHALCWNALDSSGARAHVSRARCCRCAGACVGAESQRRTMPACAQRLHPMPSRPGPIRDLPASASEQCSVNGRTSTFFATGAGSALRKTMASSRAVETPPRPAFDADIARLLIRTFARRQHGITARIGGAAHSCAGRRTTIVSCWQSWLHAGRRRAHQRDGNSAYRIACAAIVSATQAVSFFA
jgi:DNA polymerase-3 subunit epsilon